MARSEHAHALDDEGRFHLRLLITEVEDVIFRVERLIDPMTDPTRDRHER